MNIRWILGLFLLLLLISIGSYVKLQTLKPSTIAASPTLSSSSSMIPSPTVSAQVAYYYPITNYVNRLTNRHYGQTITPSDRQGLPCGAPFTGLHDADDLEVTTAELTADIPIYAIAAGTVRQVSQVNGYGGLLVIQHSLNNQVVTANYGHINLQRTTVKTGDHVTAGQLVSYLGDACSNQTDGERKHLHFALHRGSAIDIKGYVTTPSELAAWLNPSQVLENVQAQNPQ
jgi:murein DD-endopeptidase MepM/ murein hydrolase activator NlpD